MNKVPKTITDVFHGVPVEDPFRHLEDRQSPATQAWIKEEEERNAAFFARVSGMEWIRKRVDDYLNREVMDQPVRVGSRLFYRMRHRGQEQASICVCDRDAGVERVLVDPRDHGGLGAVAIYRISSDGSHLAYQLRRNGSDKCAVHLVDVETGSHLSESLSVGYAHGFLFAPDGSGFFYCHECNPGSSEHAVYFHSFDDPGGEDQVVFDLPRQGDSRLSLLGDGLRMAVVFHRKSADGWLRDLHVNDCSRTGTWMRVVSESDNFRTFFLGAGRIFALAKSNVAGALLIELSTDGRPLRTLLSSDSRQIVRFAIVNGYLWVHFRAGLSTCVELRTLEGLSLEELSIPDEETIEFVDAYTDVPKSLFAVHESFGHAPEISEFESSAWGFESCKRRWGGGVPATYSVRRVRYRSADDTEIPMTLVTLPGRNTSPICPVILTSYGGFGTSMMPKFSVLVAIMLEAGAIFAMPHIRGGSEFGTAWHDAGKGRNRQASFDDFISAAEWLCEQGITTPQKLAIFGGSNSGLLTGVAMTQRPDLFRAVLCIAPLLDMVRYESFDMAARWRSEYGTVEDPDDFRALLAYSPYHHVHEEVNYPSVLFVTGDSDDRCNPAHVRKMAARLRGRACQSNPILVDHSCARGHMPVLPITTRVDALTKRIAFLCLELGMSMTSETFYEATVA